MPGISNVGNIVTASGLEDCRHIVFHIELDLKCLSSNTLTSLDTSKLHEKLHDCDVWVSSCAKLKALENLEAKSGALDAAAAQKRFLDGKAC